jgi:hypothetical protein
MVLGSRKNGLTGLQSMVLLVAMAGVATPRSLAQAAPVLLPYTITAIGGGTSTVCGATGSDKIGNGCPATQASFGATSAIASGGDTRALSVDPQGDIIIADGGASMVRKISPKTGLVTVVAGSLSSAAACTLGAGTPVDKYGDGCIATDGTANLNGGYSGNFNKPRGVYAAPNGDIYIAGYGDYMVHKITAATGVMSIVAGYCHVHGIEVHQLRRDGGLHRRRRDGDQLRGCQWDPATQPHRGSRVVPAARSDRGLLRQRVH